MVRDGVRRDIDYLTLLGETACAYNPLRTCYPYQWSGPAYAVPPRVMSIDLVTIGYIDGPATKWFANIK